MQIVRSDSYGIGRLTSIHGVSIDRLSDLVLIIMFLHPHLRFGCWRSTLLFVPASTTTLPIFSDSLSSDLLLWYVCSRLHQYSLCLLHNPTRGPSSPGHGSPTALPLLSRDLDRQLAAARQPHQSFLYTHMPCVTPNPES